MHVTAFIFIQRLILTSQQFLLWSLGFVGGSLFSWVLSPWALIHCLWSELVQRYPPGCLVSSCHTNTSYEISIPLEVSFSWVVYCSPFSIIIIHYVIFPVFDPCLYLFHSFFWERDLPFSLILCGLSGYHFAWSTNLNFVCFKFLNNTSVVLLLNLPHMKNGSWSAALNCL